MSPQRSQRAVAVLSDPVTSFKSTWCVWLLVYLVSGKGGRRTKAGGKKGGRDGNHTWLCFSWSSSLLASKILGAWSWRDQGRLGQLVCPLSCSLPARAMGLASFAVCRPLRFCFLSKSWRLLLCSHHHCWEDRGESNSGAPLSHVGASTVHSYGSKAPLLL